MLYWPTVTDAVFIVVVGVCKIVLLGSICDNLSMLGLHRIKISDECLVSSWIKGFAL